MSITKTTDKEIAAVNDIIGILNQFDEQVIARLVSTINAYYGLKP